MYNSNYHAVINKIGADRKKSVGHRTESLIRCANNWCYWTVCFRRYITECYYNCTFRLWHELTEELLILVKEDYFKTNGGLMEVCFLLSPTE